MTSTLQPRLMQVLTWGEWGMMAAVFILLIVAGMGLIKLVWFAYKVIRGE